MKFVVFNEGRPGLPTGMGVVDITGANPSLGRIRRPVSMRSLITATGK